ncbi:MAG: TonB-dependent receptor [Aquisalinus sp.]|nr:TonB-dependent receptor [Aquisalinus sp.]
MSNLHHTKGHFEVHTPRKLKALLLASAFLPAVMICSPAMAQQAEDAASEDDDVIVVEGTRRTIQNSIDAKREANNIVDALTVDDIGDIPALSIGEALETLTGAASHREQGGATEIAVRGLGPFLGSTVINGREAANGSGDRSVNFSQFPSELFNKLEIYKTQEASLIEGGVSGQIALSTLKPLDYGKRRIQGELKGEYHPDNVDLNNNERDLGYRGTFSIVDNFDVEGMGRLGFSFGVQTRRTTNPEQEARTSSGFRDCRNVVSGDPDSDDFGVDSLGDADQNCDSGGGDLVLEVDPATGVAPDADTPFVLVSSQRHFRQNITDDERDSVFGAVQWQPNDRWDINADFEYSDRTFTERRSDLTIDGNSLLNVGEDGEIVPLSVAGSGALLGGTTFDGAEISSQYAERLEEYTGGGISASYDVSDKLTVSADLSYSDTSRRENIIQARLRSDTDGDTGSEDIFVGFDVQGDVHTFTFRDFDVTDPNNFDVGPRVREDLNQFRNNTITAFRTDFDYAPDDGFVTNVLGGLRLSKLEYDSVPRVRRETDGNPLAVGDAAAAAACLNNVFPESGFLSSVANGPVITNIDANGNVLPNGTGGSWVSYDPLCLAEALLGRAPGIPGAGDVFLSSSELGTGQNPLQIVDVEEETLAGYLQANYNGTLGQYPVRGNFGVRIVDTEVTSNGFRGDLTIDRDTTTGEITGIGVDNSNLIRIQDKHSYTEVLPSANIVVDLQDDLLFRGAIFRALSRPDPSDLGVGRSFGTDIDNDNGSTDVADIVAQVQGFGNPKLDPLLSWNLDAALEWYPNPDTILAVGLYYKSFQGGFSNVGQFETFTVDGEDLQAIVTTQETSDEENTITGIEVTAAHSFNYLPGAWSGLGFKLSYNYADSDFEFEDAQFGASTVIASDGTEIQRVGIVPPANVPGLSEQVASAQVYYNIGNFDIQGIYKYRSEYFQQFISTPGNLRYIDDTSIYEARVSYQVNDNVRLSLEGINLFDEPRVQYNPTPDSFAEVNVYGPRLFFGVRGKF